MKLHVKQTNAHAQFFRPTILESGPNGTRKTMEQRICETDEFSVWSKKPRD